MSRSRRKTPKRAVTTAESEKEEKAAARRKERRLIKKVLKKDPDIEVLPDRRQLSNPWMMAKDGKTYLGRDAPDKLLRK